MPWPSFQGIVDNLLSALIAYLVVLVGTYVMTRWIYRVLDYVPLPVLVLIGFGIYGLFMFCLNQTMRFFRGEPQLIASAPIVIPSMLNEELEKIIREWLDDMRFHVQRGAENENKHFSFTIQGVGRIPVEVVKLKKELKQFITLRSALFISEEYQKKFMALSEHDRSRVFKEMTLEFERERVGIEINLPKMIIVEDFTPIAELTQAKLVDTFKNVSSAIVSDDIKLQLLLDELSIRNESDPGQIRQ